MKKYLITSAGLIFLALSTIAIAALNLEFTISLPKNYFYPNETIPMTVNIINRESTYSARNLNLLVSVGQRTFNFGLGDLTASQSISKNITLPELPSGTYVIRGILNYTGYFGETATVETYNSFDVKFPEIQSLPRNIFIKSFDVPNNVTQDKPYQATITVINNGTIPADLVVSVNSVDSNISKSFHLDPQQTQTITLDVTSKNAGITLLEARVYAVVDNIKYLMNYIGKNVFVQENRVAKLSLDRIELVDEPDEQINQNDEANLKVYLRNEGDSAASDVKATLSSSEITVTRPIVDYKLLLPKETNAADYFSIKTVNAIVGQHNLTIDVTFNDLSGSQQTNFLIPVDVKRDFCSNNSQCGSDEICSNGVCSKLSCGYCEYAKDHSCLKFQCCSDKECKQNEFCDVDNTCKRKICVDVQNNGSPTDKLDIVFVGDDYSDGQIDKFEFDVKAHTEKILSVYPFSALKNKINVHRVDKFVDLGCKIYGDRCVICDDTKVKETASFCPNDKIIVLYNTDRWAGCAGLFDVAAASSKYPFISLHEFGHSFGGLWDEYSYGGNGFSAKDSPNCDDNGSCLKWSGISDAGCFKGCTRDNFFRSIENGIMRTVSDKFGVINENQLIKLLSKYK